MSDTPTARVASGTPSSNNRLVVWQSIIAGLSYIAGAGALADVLPQQVAALLFVFVGGLQSATAAYVAATKPVQTPVEVVTVDLHKP